MLDKLFRKIASLKTSCSEKSVKYRSSRSQIRSSRPEMFCKKGVLKNFAKFTGKHLSQSLFFHKVADLRPQAFFCEFCEIFNNTFFYRIPLVAAAVSSCYEK